MSNSLTSLPTVYPEEIAQKGTHIYRGISQQIEKEHWGSFVAIEVESGKYFIGETQIEAIEKAKKSFQDKIFYLMKIGFPAVVTFSGYQRPLSYGNIPG